MKKKKPFLTLLLLLCVGFANGQTFVVDGLQYTVTTAPEVSVNKDGTTCPTGALTIPSLVTDPGTNIEYTVRTIEANSFENCSALTSVVIGDSLTSIGLSAFSGCSSLTSVTLPNSLTSIGDFAFNACSGLTSVTFGDSLTSIGQQAFGNCSGLTSVTFGDSLNSIGFAAFGNCSGLTSLTLPNSVTSIGDFAFFGCSGLTEVTVAWQTPLVISSDVFSGLTLSGITLKVPEGEIATYEAAAVWQDFSVEVNTLSTNENSLLNPSFFINPNPASYSIAVSGLKQTATYKLYNVLGAKIMKGTLSVNAKIEIEQLTNGVYFLKINNGTTLRFIKK